MYLYAIHTHKLCSRVIIIIITTLIHKIQIVIQIFEYLHSADLRVAALACQRWFNATQHRRFATQFGLDFANCTLHDNTDPLAILATSARSYSSIRMLRVDMLSGAGVAFWSRFADTLRSVRIEHCDLRERTLKSILLSLQNLQRLEIHNCRELFMSGRLFETDADADAIRVACAGIEHLALINNRYLSDALFRRFVSLMPRLRSLDLSRLHISFHPGLYRRFYPANRPADQASESVLTFQYIAQFLTGPVAHSLTHLNLSETLVDENALRTIGDCAELRLLVLELRCCDQLTSGSIVALVRQQRQLRELDVSYLARLTDEALTAIGVCLPELRVLRLSRCPKITDVGVKELARLRRLRVLDISDCDQLTGEALLGGVAKEHSDRMRELNVASLQICHRSIMRAVEAFPELRVLNVSRCKNGVTDVTVQWICRYALRLRELRMAYCDKVSECGVGDAL